MQLAQHARKWDSDPDPIGATPPPPQPKGSRRIKIKYGTLFCSLMILCVFVNLVQLHWQIVKLDREIELQVQQKQQLLTYQAKLREEMGMVQSGDYIEKLAREQLRMVKPGENPVVTRTDSGDNTN